MPYIVARRVEVQAGALQITDLIPNQSLANPTVDARPQGPFYVRPADFGAKFGSIPHITSTLSKRTLSSEARGVSAYILRHVENGANAALTATQAVDIAKEIEALVRSGAVINAKALNDACVDVLGAGRDFDGTATNSNGVVEEMIRILAGESYILPQGAEIQDEQGNFVAIIGDAGLQRDVRTLVEKDASWKVSLLQGTLRGLVDPQPATSVFGGGDSLDPLVTLYQADGELYPV